MSIPTVRVTDAAGANFLDFIVANDIGSNLLKTASCDWLRIGEDIGARYNIAIVPSSISAGPKTAQITLVARNAASGALISGTNPRADGDVFSVVFDGSTTYDGTIIPDVRMVFNDMAVVGTVDTWTAHITVGDYLGAFADGNPGGAIPGDPVYGPVKLGIKNTSGTLKQSVKISIAMPPILLWPKNGTRGGLQYVRMNTAGAVEKEDVGTLQTLPYKGTFANLNGGTNRIDYLIDGIKITTVRDIDISPTTTSDSLQILRNNRYRIESGGLNGVEFKIQAAAANTDTHNIIIWDRRAVKIAADVSGSPGTFGTTDVTIGNLAPAALGNWWIQVDANVGSGEKNPLPVGVRTQWLNTGVAAIEAP